VRKKREKIRDPDERRHTALHISFPSQIVPTPDERVSELSLKQQEEATPRLDAHTWRRSEDRGPIPSEGFSEANKTETNGLLDSQKDLCYF